LRLQLVHQTLVRHLSLALTHAAVLESRVWGHRLTASHCTASGLVSLCACLWRKQILKVRLNLIASRYAAALHGWADTERNARNVWANARSDARAA